MNKIILNGITVTIFNGMDDLLGFVNAGKSLLIAVNAEKIINRDPEIKEIINTNTGYLDGIGPVLAARRKGFSEARKIPGCELWLKLVERFCLTRSFYLLGSTGQVVEETARKLQKEFPGISIVGNITEESNHRNNKHWNYWVWSRGWTFSFGSYQSEWNCCRVCIRHK